MMARRILLSADAPHLPVRKGRGKLQALDVTVLMGDHRLPDQVKRGGTFNPEDLETVRKLKDALAELPDYKFRFLDNHGTLERDLAELRTDLVFNLCDEGWNNDPFKELHVPALLEVLGIGYTGAGPSALAACYDKGLVRAVAQGARRAGAAGKLRAPGRPGRDAAVGVPGAAEAEPGRQQPGHHQGLRRHQREGAARLARPAARGLPQARRAGAGVPDRRRVLGAADRQSGPGPAGAADPGGRLLALDEKLPKILGYEFKWLPDSPYWTQIKYREATLADQKQQQMIDSSSRLFERLGCRDYARFDFRADAKGEIKLLEVNPNPGWCWDGKMNLMAGFQGMRYSELLGADPAGGRGAPRHHRQAGAQPAANGNGHAVAAE